MVRNDIEKNTNDLIFTLQWSLSTISFNLFKRKMIFSGRIIFFIRQKVVKIHQSAVKCLFILSIVTPLGNQASLLHPTQLIQSMKKGSLTQKHQGFLMWMYGYPKPLKVSKNIGEVQVATYLIVLFWLTALIILCFLHMLGGGNN